MFQRKPLIEELDDKLEPKPLVVQGYEERDTPANKNPSDSNARIPVIEEITEQFSQLNHPPSEKPGKPLIEEIVPVTEERIEDKRLAIKSLVTEVSRDSTEEKELGLNAAGQESADSQSSLGPTWATLQKLAEQVGSTIEREPIDISKEKRAFLNRMHHTNLGDLD